MAKKKTSAKRLRTTPATKIAEKRAAAEDAIRAELAEAEIPPAEIERAKAGTGAQRGDIKRRYDLSRGAMARLFGGLAWLCLGLGFVGCTSRVRACEVVGAACSMVEAHCETSGGSEP